MIVSDICKFFHYMIECFFCLELIQVDNTVVIARLFIPRKQVCKIRISD